MGRYFGDYFVYALAGLEIMASVSYCAQGELRRGVFWACLALANLMMAGLK